MANLALTYGNQGRWKKAEELGVQITETRKMDMSGKEPKGRQYDDSSSKVPDQGGVVAELHPARTSERQKPSGRQNKWAPEQVGPKNRWAPE
jgi:hypothetical protein